METPGLGIEIEGKRPIIPEQINVTEVILRQEGEGTSDYLSKLESTGRFLFHGSPDIAIDKLEPRQATDKSGDPRVNDLAVFAVDKAVIAVQRSIIPKREEITGSWEVRGGTNPQNPTEPLLQITENVTLGDGMVYVLPRDGFEYIEGWNQWKKKGEVLPLAKVAVTQEDYSSLGGKTEKIRRRFK